MTEAGGETKGLSSPLSFNYLVAQSLDRQSQRRQLALKAFDFSSHPALA